MPSASYTAMQVSIASPCGCHSPDWNSHRLRIYPALLALQCKCLWPCPPTVAILSFGTPTTLGSAQRSFQCTISVYGRLLSVAAILSSSSSMVSAQRPSRSGPSPVSGLRGNWSTLGFLVRILSLLCQYCYHSLCSSNQAIEMA